MVVRLWLSGSRLWGLGGQCFAAGDHCGLVGAFFRVSAGFLWDGLVSNALFLGGCCLVIYGEFDPGSGRTLAACLTHASRTVMPGLALVDQWRTGE